MPQFFGTCPDDSDTQIDGVLGIFIQSDWEQMQADEMAMRPQPPSIQTIITVAAQARLDDFAKTRNYDSILSACTYATSTIPKFFAEGQYCVAQRDATWSTMYQIMAEVEAGTRPMPASYADIELDLPALVWPV